MESSRRRGRRWLMWISSAALAGACAFAVPGAAPSAFADPIVDVVVAPPAARVETIPAPPSPHHFWVHGYWGWNGRAHYWVPGRYEMARPGWHYREARWAPGRGGHWQFHQGGWHR